MAHLQISELIEAPKSEVFEYLTAPSHQAFLLSPALTVEALTPDGPIKRGDEVHFNMTRFGLSQSIRFKIEDLLPGSRLAYRQSEGVFRAWTHTIKFEEHSENTTLVTDLVDYQVPMGILGFLADDLLLKGDMARILKQRLQKTKEHFSSL
jgi:ligand-binding SRPBCC domain-containing protein